MIFEDPISEYIHPCKCPGSELGHIFGEHRTTEHQGQMINKVVWLGEGHRRTWQLGGFTACKFPLILIKPHPSHFAPLPLSKLVELLLSVLLPSHVRPSCPGTLVGQQHVLPGLGVQTKWITGHEWEKEAPQFFQVGTSFPRTSPDLIPKQSEASVS